MPGCIADEPRDREVGASCRLRMNLWNYTSRGPLPHQEGTALMMVYQEKIAPPANSRRDEETKLIAESLVRDDDRWVKNLIDGLAGILRDVKH
jgi:hypothetical protein